MKILVTRPEPAASLMAETIREMGHDAIVCPLTCEVQIDFDPLVIDEPDAWILTSARAAFALAELPPRPVYAVGRSTERAARDAGARDVSASGSNWHELGELILNSGLPPGARLVHLCGRDINGDLASLLRDSGLYYHRVVVYAMEPVADAAGLVELALRRGSVEGVALMSPRAATIFCNIISAKNLHNEARNLCVLALSDDIAAAARPLAAHDVRISPRQDVRALLRQLDASSG
ncbi:MAG: uroporphyrinogen-III synthase [Geminicoccaceae bacterium]|nr:uroporphyrinogen-III synthase [Geminicoccaceae bacterium]MCB9945407.1 uroporphyrinogen-III synthase [Geminicoccaceae bacterium]